MHFDLVEFIKWAGLLGVIAVVFAESGLLVGFFLPGDSLLFTAGFLASQGYIQGGIVALIIGCVIAAITGDSVGYAFGRKVGPAIFNREDSLLFHKSNLLKANAFYEQHGGKTIILARFLPVVRTFAPIVAGVGAMHYRMFLAYNVIGGLLWGIGIPLAGYFLGQVIPDVDKYLLPIIILIILASIAPTAWHLLKDPEQRAQIRQLVNRLVTRRSL
jgi:membrane-associated protein